MFEGFKVIDTHCHIFPEKIAEKAAAATDRFYAFKSLYPATAASLAENGTAAGVDGFVISSVATTPAQVSSINRFIAEQAASRPDIFTGIGSLHPRSEDQAACVRELCELGLHGIKMHPEIQGYKVDDDGMMEIYDLCGSAGIPVLLHTGDSRYDNSNPDRLRSVVTAFPKTTFIGAHFGGYTVWEEAREKLAGLENFYVDTSSSLFFIGVYGGKKMIDFYGPDRVMFGTDFPMHDFRQEMRSLLWMGYSEDDTRKMLSGNAEKVYGAR